MAYFDLSQYQTVQERIDLFWSAFPDGRLNLEIVSMTDAQVVMKAEVFLNKDDNFPAAVDYAEERLGSSPVKLAVVMFPTAFNLILLFSPTVAILSALSLIKDLMLSTFALASDLAFS